MKKLVISNSMLRSLTTCSTQAWLRTNGYSTSSDENKAARAGRDAHLAFEKWHRGERPDDCVQTFLNAYQPYSEKLLLSKDAYYHENLSRILSVFFATNPLSTLPYEVVETEKQIELSLGVFNGVEFVVSDKSDGLGRMKDTGAFFPIECKTVNYIGENYTNDYELDSQITTHIEAWRQNGIDAKGVVLQAVQFSKLPDPNATTLPSKKTGLVRPLTCRIAGHGPVSTCWQNHVKFGRFEFVREQEHIDTWKRNTWESLVKYVTILGRNLETIAQEGLFGSCGRCEFLAFCKGHRRNLDSLFMRQREEGILYSGLYEV